MVNFTSNETGNFFSNKISRTLPKPERKFVADMNYGILAFNSCLLTDIADQLYEPSKKINIVDCLSRHLTIGIPKDALKSYLLQVKKWCPSHPVFILMTAMLSNLMMFIFIVSDNIYFSRFNFSYAEYNHSGFREIIILNIS